MTPRSSRPTRRSYEGVAVSVPVTVPYVRYSTHGAHWFIGRAIEALVERSGIAKDEIDGLTVSSFSLAPDTAVGVTQHLGLSPRWLDHIPTGGASGVMALRRAALASSIVEHALAQLAYYKAPGYVAFVEALPLTLSQKIQRGELRTLAGALPSQPHCVDTRAMKKRQG